jgi:hypothetical protein
MGGRAENRKGSILKSAEKPTLRPVPWVYARLRIQEFLRIVRDQPAPPLEIKIVNAKEVFSTAKILSVKRDDSGKLSRATIEPIN